MYYTIKGGDHIYSFVGIVFRFLDIQYGFFRMESLPLLIFHGCLRDGDIRVRIDLLREWGTIIRLVDYS